MMRQVLETKDMLLRPPTRLSGNQVVPIHVEQWKVYAEDGLYRDLRQPATKHFLHVLWNQRKLLAAEALLSRVCETVASQVRALANFTHSRGL